MRSDVDTTGLTPGKHPFSYVRAALPATTLRAGDLGQHLAGRIVDVAGVVTHRQRPHTGGGITFLSLEDETGLVNVEEVSTRVPRVERTPRPRDARMG